MHRCYRCIKYNNSLPLSCLFCLYLVHPSFLSVHHFCFHINCFQVPPSLTRLRLPLGECWQWRLEAQRKEGNHGQTTNGVRQLVCSERKCHRFTKDKLRQLTSSSPPLHFPYLTNTGHPPQKKTSTHLQPQGCVSLYCNLNPPSASSPFGNTVCAGLCGVILWGPTVLMGTDTQVLIWQNLKWWFVFRPG